MVGPVGDQAYEIPRNNLAQCEEEKCGNYSRIGKPTMGKRSAFVLATIQKTQ